MLKKFFWTFFTIALVVWSASWWSYALFMKAAHAPGWSEARLIRYAEAFFAVFTVGYLIIQAVALRKSGFGWVAVPFRLFFSVICLVTILAMQKPNAEGFDIAFLFLLAFLSGSIVYSKGHKFQIGRFILALLFWFFIIFTNEMIIQRHLSFRRSQISDIIYDMAGVLIGLSLSARWLWTKKAGKWHRLSLLG